MIRTRSAAIRAGVLALALFAVWRAASAGSPERSDARASGLAAWGQVYAVMTSPRCLNCHTSTNFPEQGDDRHRHLFNVVRGPHDAGVPGLKCATCHQGANADSTGVPGAPGWRLAPLSMAWQDPAGRALSSAAVCRSVLDSRDGPGLIKHHAEEPLVLWAFKPGRRRDGTARALPPLTHGELVAATRRWAAAGTPCP